MSGVIAYFADIVGKKLGKKRLSIFKLRPRHTATLGTVLVGIVISTFTIAAALMISSPMRQALLQGLEIRSRLDQDQKDLKRLQGEMEGSSHRSKELTKSNGILTKSITEKTSELSKRQDELNAAQNKLAALNEKIDTLQGRIATLQSDVSQKRLALETSGNNLKSARADLHRIQAELKNNLTNLKSVQKEIRGIEDKNADLYTKNDELIAKQKSLNADLDQIKLDVAGLEKAKETALSSLAKSQDQLKEVSSQLNSAQARLAETQSQLHDAEINFERYKFIAGVSRNQPMIFKVGEEVIRLPVPAHLSVNGARGAMTTLLRRAVTEAHRRGAQRHAYPEAAIVDHTDPQTNQTISPQMIENSIVNQITNSPIQKVLIAVSSLNAFFGESVSLEVSVMPDPLVYISGQEVAETVIDGSRDDVSIFDGIRKFLQETVKGRAQRDGMIPVANSDVSFGQVPQADLLQVISQLHNANRTIRLEAHAVGDIYAADSLKLEFRLR